MAPKHLVFDRGIAILAEQLNKAWTAQRDSTHLDEVMRFAREGLMLGAGTVLAKSSGHAREVSIDPAEPRLRALLTAAHLRSPTPEQLSHLSKAAQKWSDGEDVLALIHLALSRLLELQQPEADAYRLFLADALLKAGCEPQAIIDAIEVGDSALHRVRKYSPDQPRVPAGSGRTSGQWTSTVGGASPDEPPTDSSRPEVNPDTVTPIADQQYETPYACEVANAHCQEAAVLASAGDAANDNGPRSLDLKACRNAYFACKALSASMQLQPFPLSGGVIFPHRGLVIISKGRVDRYIPPSGGEFPNVRRSLECAGAAALSTVQDADTHSAPPWTPELDETNPSSSAGFSECRKVIADFASAIDGKVVALTPSLSKRWGKIVRARITFDNDDSISRL